MPTKFCAGVAAMALAMLASGCERAAALETSRAEGRPTADRTGRGRSAPSKCPQLKPARPKPVKSAAPRLPRSSISVNIPLALSSLQPEIDRLIPANLSDPGWPNTHRVADEVCASWYFSRSPISLGAVHQQLTIAIPGKFGMIADPYVAFAGLGCTKPYVSCGNGTAGAPPIPVTINLEATLTFTRSYQFSGGVTNRGTSFAQPCQLASGIVDATPIVQGILDEQIEKQLAHVNDTIRDRADFRGQVETAWKAMQQPRKLASDLWLVVRPDAVSGGLAVVDASTIAAQIAVEGNIEIIQAATAPAAAPTALPELSAPAQPASGARVAMSGSLPYATIASQFQQELSGKQLSIELPAGKQHNVTVRDVQISGPVACAASPPCLEVAVELDGDVCGVVYLVGRPEHDASRGEIVLRDVDFSIDTSNAVLNMAAWLGRTELAKRITDAARFSISPAIERIEKIAGTIFPVPLSGSLELTGSVGALKLSLGAGPSGIDYQLALTGALAVTQKTPAGHKPPSTQRTQ